MNNDLRQRIAEAIRTGSFCAGTGEVIDDLSEFDDVVDKILIIFAETIPTVPSTHTYRFEQWSNS